MTRVVVTWHRMAVAQPPSPPQKNVIFHNIQATKIEMNVSFIFLMEIFIIIFTSQKLHKRNYHNASIVLWQLSINMDTIHSLIGPCLPLQITFLSFQFFSKKICCYFVRRHRSKISKSQSTEPGLFLSKKLNGSEWIKWIEQSQYSFK